MGKVVKKIIPALVAAALLLLAVTIVRGANGHGGLNFLSYYGGPYRVTETNYDYRCETLSVDNEGQTIAGKLFMPKDDAETHKLVIISHGFNCPASYLVNKAKTLAKAGYAAVVYDFRGGSTGSTSEGDMEDMTVYTEISDLNHMVDALKEDTRIDSDEVFLMGESFGGLVSALTAAERDDVKGLILCFPALMVGENARESWSSVDEIPETMNVSGFTTGKAFWAALYDLDVYGTIVKYTGPVLILHGTADPNVDYSYSQRADEVYENSELILIDGAEHCFGGKDAKTTLKKICEFISEN